MIIHRKNPSTFYHYNESTVTTLFIITKHVNSLRISMLEKQIIHSFVSIVGEDNVDTSNMGRLTYSYDATPNFKQCLMQSLLLVIQMK